MKEKVLAALKTRYSNLGLSEKVLGRVAAYLAKTVKDETEIENAVSDSDVKDMLSEMQSDADRLRTEKQKIQSELEELKKTPKNEGKNEGGERKNDDIPEYLKGVLDYINSAKERDKANEIQNKFNDLKSKAKEELKLKGIKESLCDEYLKGTSFSESLTVSDLVKVAVEKNDFFVSQMTPESGPPRTGGGSKETKSEEDDWFIAKTKEMEDSKIRLEELTK